MNRREFLKRSFLLAAGVAAGCDARPVLAPTGVSKVPSEQVTPLPYIEKTATPNIPATKEVERINAILAEGYPTKFDDLTTEEMLSENDFLAQLKKFPNVEKEYAQVKAMLSSELSKAGVSLDNVVFETSSFAWDNDKYSWIVIARNKTTNEVYVPRSKKSFARNLDMSVNEYLKDGLTDGFTLETLKLPEFSGPEYKVGFARSKNGWLVATLDGGGQKGWYDFRDKEIARWKNDKDKAFVSKKGLLLEDRKYDGSEYSVAERAKLELYRLRIDKAFKDSKIYTQDQGLTSLGINVNGTCELVKENDITVGLRRCYRKDGSYEEIATAWMRNSGAIVVPSGETTFAAANPSEKGVKLVFDDMSSLPEGTDKIVNLANGALNKDGYHVEYPLEDKATFIYRKQSRVVSMADYRAMMLVKYLPPRPGEVELIGWGVIPEGVKVDDKTVDEWINQLFTKDAKGEYVCIIFEPGISKLVIDEEKMRRCLSYLKDPRIPSWIKAYILKRPLAINVGNIRGVTQTGKPGPFGSKYMYIGETHFSEFLLEETASRYFATLMAHEQIHGEQPVYNPAQAVDKEFQAYYFQCLMSYFMQLGHRLSIENMSLLYNGGYKRNVQ